MVEIEVDVIDGILTKLVIRGHDMSVDGEGSLPCGIVSALARTTARFIEQEEGIRWSGDAPEPGNFWLSVYAVPEASRRRIQGVTGFLLTGLQDAEKDFPKSLHLKINSK